MNHDRNAFITAYRAHYGGTQVEVDRILRGVEATYAARQNTELEQALDEADGQHMKELAAYRGQIAAMNHIMANYPEAHARFGSARADGTVEEPDQCADFCYACKLNELQDQLNNR